MYLRSGRLYQSGQDRNAELESRISTEESFHQFGGLNPIPETLETASKTSSEMASHSTNPFANPIEEMGDC